MDSVTQDQDQHSVNKEFEVVESHDTVVNDLQIGAEESVEQQLLSPLWRHYKPEEIDIRIQGAL